MIISKLFLFVCLFPKDQELQQTLLWVEKFPTTCLKWFWGNKASVVIYDPDYMKLILGRSGESKPHCGCGR